MTALATDKVHEEADSDVNEVYGKLAKKFLVTSEHEITGREGVNTDHVSGC